MGQIFDEMDVQNIADGFAEVRGDNERQIALRRGQQTIDAQAFRIALAGQMTRTPDVPFDHAAGAAVLIGAADANLQAGDRFALDGVTYVVQLVNPDRRFGTFATLAATTA
jgi:hypothetical protein